VELEKKIENSNGGESENSIVVVYDDHSNSFASNAIPN
jgi:hypothetical protein